MRIHGPPVTIEMRAFNVCFKALLVRQIVSRFCVKQLFLNANRCKRKVRLYARI